MVPPFLAQTMGLAVANGTAEVLRRARLLQAGLAWLLIALKPPALNQ
jgi:hypothetical protein